MEILSFKDLMVWQKSMNLVLDVYELSDAYPRYELFGLAAHTRKTATSIPSNIAEGCCRRALPAYVNHLNIAMGSEGELFTQLEVARRRGYVEPAAIEKCFQDLSEVGRMLNGLAATLERKIEQNVAKQSRRCTP
jgi:four helix bundle protein